MNVLYIGGTGEISYACIHAGAAIGHKITVFNRGVNDEPLPAGVERITGDLKDEQAYRALATRRFDVVCQFKAFTVEEIERDISLFSGQCGQYVFISSASAYQKPPVNFRITEETPLVNPFWEYSRKKAAMEAVLIKAHEAGKLAVTNIRPSHTYRRNFPVTLGGGDLLASRLLRGKPVVVHGDGTSLWVVTHAEDFAYPFVRLLGRPQALGQAFHITSEDAWTWNQIINAVAEAVGATADVVHVPTATLVKHHPDWNGPLWGDKSNSVWFDNTKVKNLVPDWRCEIAMPAGMKRVADHWRRRKDAYKIDEKTDGLLDAMAALQRGV